LAFIARGRRHFLVTAGVHHGGMKHAPPQTKTVPLMAFIYYQNRRGWRWWAVVKETASFSNSKNISSLVLGCFCNFVIKLGL
jgi:hypothetical protein